MTEQKKKQKKVPGTFFFIVVLFLLSSLVPTVQASTPRKLIVGEKLVYSVRVLGVPVGRGEAEVREIVPVNGRPAYHLVVEVRSSSIIDLIYKVRDTHHSYLDVEKLHSLRYEKILREGRYRADEVMEYDQENHTAVYFSRKNGSRKEMLIPPDVQDQLSCGYWFRLQEVRPGTEIKIPVNADEKNWDLRVKILNQTKLKVKGIGSFEAVELEPEIEFQGIFVKRGKIHGWLGLDERRIPLKMTVKVPILGRITAILVKYKSPK